MARHKSMLAIELETILVVQSAENRLRDDSMTITNLMDAGE